MNRKEYKEGPNGVTTDRVRQSSLVDTIPLVVPLRVKAIRCQYALGGNRSNP